MLSRIVVAVVVTAAALPACAETQQLDAGGIAVNAETVAGGLQHPWGMEFLPDGAVLVTERPGRMRLIADGKVSEPVAGVPEVAARGRPWGRARRRPSLDVSVGIESLLAVADLAVDPRAVAVPADEAAVRGVAPSVRNG